MNVRIAVTNGSSVTFKMTEIDGIESYLGRSLVTRHLKVQDDKS